MICRACGHKTKHVFFNLQHSPPANAFLSKEQLQMPERYFPLCVYVCEKCFLVQIEESATSVDIFNAGYVYFSSYSEEFVRHAENYVTHITDFLGLNEQSMVYEAASNDGYLLQFFCRKGIPCLGIEPSNSVADVALKKNVPTVVEFFTASFASRLIYKHGKADLFLGNNVLAHVPDLNDFIAGIGLVIKADGIATLEFPHLLHLIRNLEFDTVYHEHYSYFSLLALTKAFQRHGLKIFHVEELNIHGGSLRIYAAHEKSKWEMDSSVDKVLKEEFQMGLDRLDTYSGFQEKINSLCTDFMNFILSKKKEGAKIIAYGAAAKGNTLLNYSGIKPYMIDFICDITPAKQGKFLPGTHIPVYPEEKIMEYRPDYIVILPWNWKQTIFRRLSYVREWGAKFVTVIPHLEVTDSLQSEKVPGER